MKTNQSIKYPSIALVLCVILFAALWEMPATLRAQSPTPTPGDLFVSRGAFPGPNGAGSILEYAPNGTQTIFASGLSRPRGLVFDNAGNFFVATNQRTCCDLVGNVYFVGTVYKITSGGVKTPVATG